MSGIVGTSGSKSHTIGSIIHPTGYVHQVIILGEEGAGEDCPSKGTANTTFEDSDINTSSFVTRRSSSNSMLIFELNSGMSNITNSSYAGYSALTLNSSGADTTYDIADDVYGANIGADHSNRYHPTNTGYMNQMQRWLYDPARACRPNNMTSYSAGATLYPRIFIKVNNTSATYNIVHQSSYYIFSVSEIEI